MEEVARTISVAASGGAVAVAFSGGLDSTVLLHAVATLARPRRLRAVHVNHGLHEDADAWQRHCAAFAAAVAVPFNALCVEVPAGNVEAGARRVRYQAWGDALDRDELLLLAHHADDQAETVLWQLATGRAPVGMPRARPLGPGRLLRPLLALRRETLAAYAEARGLRWVEDETNADTSRDRNHLRHEVLPRLEARFPGATAALAASAGDWSVGGAEGKLPVAGLDRGILRDWLGAAVSERRIDEIVRQAAARPGATPAVRLPDGRTVRRHGGMLHLVRPYGPRPPTTATVRVRAGENAALPHGSIVWRRAAQGLPGGVDWTVGYRSPGERLRPAGRGVTKELKALFREARIPPWQRPAWPVLRGPDGIVAVPGVAIVEGHAVAGGWWPDWKPR